MKQKDYKRAMDGLTAPQGAMDKALKAVRETEIKDNVISIKENKNRLRFPYAAAIAAVLVLTIALTAVFGFGAGAGKIKPAQEHSFVLKAGAAEVNSDYYVTVGKMQSRGGGFTLNYEPDLQADSYIEEWMNYTRLGITRGFEFDDIACEGENIAQVSYRTYGSTASYADKLGSVYEYIGGYFCYNEKLGNELTFSGNEIILSGELPCVNNTGTVFDEDVTSFIGFSFFDQTGKYRDEKYIGEFPAEDEYGNITMEHGIDHNAAFTDMVKDQPDYMYMDVTVTFDDGTYAVRRVVFEVVEDQNGSDCQYMLEAKLAD